MLLPLLSTSPPPPGSPWLDVLPYCLAVATGLLGWFGRRSTASAQLQKTLLDASREWVEQSQEERAHLTARISEQDEELARLRLWLLERDGEIRGLKQTRDSLIALAKRANIAIPPNDDGEPRS